MLWKALFTGVFVKKIDESRENTNTRYSCCNGYLYFIGTLANLHIIPIVRIKQSKLFYTFTVVNADCSEAKIPSIGTNK